MKVPQINTLTQNDEVGAFIKLWERNIEHSILICFLVLKKCRPSNETEATKKREVF